MRPVARIKREAENVGRVAASQRLGRFGQTARPRILHDRKPGRLPEGVRQMKVRHAAGVREFGQRQRSVEISLDGPKNFLGEHCS